MKKDKVKLICSPRSLEDIEKACDILRKRGKKKGEKTISISKLGDITIYYYDKKSDEFIEEELDL